MEFAHRVRPRELVEEPLVLPELVDFVEDNQDAAAEFVEAFVNRVPECVGVVTLPERLVGVELVRQMGDDFVRRVPFVTVHPEHGEIHVRVGRVPFEDFVRVGRLLERLLGRENPIRGFEPELLTQPLW